MRVLAVAEVDDPGWGDKLDADDEHDMTLLGYLAFLDPPKDSSAAALRSLAEHGVTTKILTGDSDRVTCFMVCYKSIFFVASYSCFLFRSHSYFYHSIFYFFHSYFFIVSSSC